MTTRVHIVNLGPDAVEVTVGSSAKTLYHGDSTSDYVYEGHEIEISEQKKTEV
jgi:hypothetical protein